MSTDDTRRAEAERAFLEGEESLYGYVPSDIFVEGYLAGDAAGYARAIAHIRAQEEEIARLRAALEPFATLAGRFDDARNPWFTWRDDNWLPMDAPRDRAFFTIGDLRSARAALGESEVKPDA